MKLESVFYIQKNKLIKKANDEIVNLENINSYSFDEISKNITGDNFLIINLPWSQVELEDEVYNEELLALLRDTLKKMEEVNHFAIILPVIDKNFETPEQISSFINAFNHTARRIKDCVSMVGYEFPEELVKDGLNSLTEDFIQTLAKKHEQYIYFLNLQNINKFNLQEKITNSDIVIL
ncbi:MAG: hypothetical protein GX677_11165 [Treponema sp.]|jgi:hypothetical protein|nr:hypothetical protein [Treponema sp.]